MVTYYVFKNVIMKKYSFKFIWIFLISGFIISCDEADSSLVTDRPDSIINNDDTDAPPRGLNQEWNDKEQALYREYYDSNIAVYYDENVNREITWTRGFTSQVWEYVKSNYGLGDDALYAVFHSEDVTPFSGNVFDEATTYKYLFDITIHDGEATTSDKDLILKQISKIVEISAFGVNTSPASNIWKGKWEEIFMYDIYTVLNLDEDAQRIKEESINSIVDYPSADTNWFKDWFLPIYEEYDGGVPLNNFYRSLSLNFIIKGTEYARDLNFGEFVHFYSAAVGDDIQALAENAFGWNSFTNLELLQARADFPSVNYPFEPTSEIVDLTGDAAITVSKDNNGGPGAAEGSLKLVDNDYYSKFLIFDYSPDINFWMQQEFSEATVINRYTITSGNDAPNRDMKTWEFSGSNDGETWDVLDSRTNESFASRNLTREFMFENEQSYKYYRIFLKENGGSSLLQISEWRLLVLRLIQS